MCSHNARKPDGSVPRPYVRMRTSSRASGGRWEEIVFLLDIGQKRAMPFWAVQAPGTWEAGGTQAFSTLGWLKTVCLPERMQLLGNCGVQSEVRTARLPLSFWVAPGWRGHLSSL